MFAQWMLAAALYSRVATGCKPHLSLMMALELSSIKSLGMGAGVAKQRQHAATKKATTISRLLVSSITSLAHCARAAEWPQHQAAEAWGDLHDLACEPTLRGIHLIPALVFSLSFIFSESVWFRTAFCPRAVPFSQGTQNNSLRAAVRLMWMDWTSESESKRPFTRCSLLHLQ